MTSSLRAVIFDWAGTMVDFGSLAPVRALQALFAAEGFDLSEAAARAAMGMNKRAHIRAILNREPMRSAWRERHGAEAGGADLDRLMDALNPHMMQAAADTAILIPGAVDIVRDLRARGVKIGSGTGYSRDMMAAIAPRAAEQGYAPDLMVCAGETAQGRPSPLMSWKVMVELGVWPARACLKVDDALVGIEEGREAGLWTVGVAASGNGVGLDRDAFMALSQAERTERVAASAATLSAAGANYVIDSVADLGALLPELERRIAAGDRPGMSE